MTVNTDIPKWSYTYYSLYILDSSKVQIANISGNEMVFWFCTLGTIFYVLQKEDDIVYVCIYSQCKEYMQL